MRYAAENITSRDDDVSLMIGVDTCVFTASSIAAPTGAITGIGCVLPKEVLHLCQLCVQAAARATRWPAAARRELEEAALAVLSSFDAGPDLVLYFKHMMVLKGDKEYTLHFNETDALSPAQRRFAEQSLKRFRTWYAAWSEAA
jgi:dihydrodipicolinate synthase/N-acetylneuraminate lyase